MYTRLRNLIIIGILLIGAAFFIRNQVSNSAAAANTQVQEISTVERDDVAITVSATGPLQANQKVSLAFTTSGKVATINVTEGDHVHKGQSIATLDSTDLNDALLSAEAKVLTQQVALNRLTATPRNEDVNVMKAALNFAQAQLYEAQHAGVDPINVKLNELNLENAKNALWQQELTRDNDTKKKDEAKTQIQKDAFPANDQEDAAIKSKDYDVAIAQANLQDAQSAHGNVSAIASAQQAVVSAQANLDDLLNGGNVNDVKQAKANLQQAQAARDLAKSNLAKMTLTAPFDGIVAQINLHVGAQTPNGAAVIMLDTSSFYVDIAVDETDVAKLAVDQPTTLTLDALPGITVNGKVSRIADAGTKTGDVVAYGVRIQIDPAGQPLRSSMSTTATVTTSIAKGVVRVRNRFVRLNRSTGKATVQLRQPDGTYKEVEVILGIRNETYSEVKSGLKPGDTIAILPSNGALRPAN